MWEWSTHRDSSGCILSPWVDKNFLCQLFKTTPLDLEKIMHQYISGDPTVSVSGTPTLSDYNPDLPIRANLRIIFAATASAMRVEIDPKNKSLRNLTVHVADHLKIKVDPKELGLCRMTVYRILKAPKNLSKIQTILRTLNDPRTVPKINQHENVTVRNKN
jgi:hypothetical protein